MRLAAAALAAGLAFTAPAALAQTEPVAVFERFLTDVLSGRIETAAMLLDTAALARIRKRYLNTPEVWADPELPTVEEMLRRDPDMPRAAAEYQIEQIRRSRTRYRSPLVYEFGLDSMAQLARTTTADLGPMWIRANEPLQRLRKQVAADPKMAPCLEGVDSLFRTRTPGIIGGVTVGDTAYVLYDFLSARFPMRSPDGLPKMARLIRRDGVWLVDPEGQLLTGMGVFVGGMGCTRSR